MDISFAAAIKNVAVKTTDAAGLIIRHCEIKFFCEFDAAIAAALGPDAKTALAALKKWGMEQVVLPLDAVNAKGTLVNRDADDRVQVAQMVGVKATCKAGDKDDGSPPTIEFVFTSLWTEPVWMFLGRYAGAHIQIDLVDRQLSMPLPVPVEVKGRSKARA